MGKTGRLAAANIRKSRGQSASFVAITVIAAVMLNLGLVTALDYTRNFDRKAESQNAPDLVFSAQEENPGFVEEFERTLLEDGRVKEVETSPCLMAQSKFDYMGGEQSRVMILMDRDQEASLGRWSMVEEAEEAFENPVYLPYLFQVSGAYRIGDSFRITAYGPGLPEREYRFAVAGFYEDTYFSTINNTTTGFLLDGEEYRRMEQELGGYARGTLFSARTADAADAEGVVSEYSSVLREKLPAGRIGDASHYAVLKSARTITSSIGAIIIVAFSILLIVISLVVEKFRIGNSVEEEMQNIGALKAIGYTSGQIVASFMAQFSLLALAGFALGTLGSCLLLPFLSEMFACQTGVRWEQGFSPAAAWYTFLGIELPALFVSFVSAHRVKRLPPITALRFGVATHSFKRNFFPLDKTGGSLNLLMAAKQLVNGPGRNLLVGVIVSGVTFAAVFAGVLYYNISVEDENFLTLTIGDTVNVRLSAADEEGARRLLGEVREHELVDRAFYYFENTVSCEGGYEAYCYVADDFTLVDNPSWNYRGRFPKYENEVSLGGLLAGQLGRDVGDVLKLSAGGVEQEYLITGLIQGTNYLGHDLCLTGEGYRRLSEDFWFPSISVYLAEGTDAGDFIKEAGEKYKDMAAAVNRDELIRGSLGIYSGIINILACVIDLITALVVALVLYLVIKTMLNRRKRELAIKKALGFTTGQLALQNACSFLPVIVLGSALGCGAGYVFINPFLSVLFSGIGLLKVNFMIPIPLLGAVFAAVTVVGFGVSLAVSSRIRRVTPYMLLSE